MKKIKKSKSVILSVSRKGGDLHMELQGGVNVSEAMGALSLSIASVFSSFWDGPEDKKDEGWVAFVEEIYVRAMRISEDADTDLSDGPNAKGG